MNRETSPALLTLRELQLGFAAALHDPKAAEALAPQLLGDAELPPAARLQVYRNNARAMFEGALGRTYPVLARKVGAQRFLAFAIGYRREHPSRHGDLHHVGREFPVWVAQQLAGTDEVWLADLARLEWACEEALVAADATPLTVQALAEVPADRLGELHFDLHPSLRLIESRFAVWSVWRAHRDESQQTDTVALPERDFTEQVLVFCATDALTLRKVSAVEFTFVAALAAGRTLVEALDASELEVEALQATLGWLFGDGLVRALRIAGN